MTHRMETYEREDGKRDWRIVHGDDVTATSGGQGFNNEEDALASLFGNFFDEWDDSFLELYQKWQNYAGSKPPEQTPETQEGVPVAEQKQPAPEGYPEDHVAQDEALVNQELTRAAGDDDKVVPGGQDETDA